MEIIDIPDLADEACVLSVDASFWDAVTVEAAVRPAKAKRPARGKKPARRNKRARSASKTRTRRSSADRARTPG